MGNRRASLRRPRVQDMTSDVIMDWSVGGTFTRASVASARPTLTSVQRYDPGVRRIERGRFLSETQGVYVSRYSKAIDNAVWTKTNCTVTADAALGPDGTLTADAIVTTTTGLVTEISETFGAAATANTTATFWIRGDSSFIASYTLAGGTTASLDFPVTTEWQQVVVRITGTFVAATITIRPHELAGTGVAGRTMYVWEVNGTNTTLSPCTMGVLNVNVTRPADSLTYVAGTWDTHLALRPFSIEWCPNTDSAGINNVCDLLSFGSAVDRISVSNVDSIQVVVGGVIFLATGIFTYSRDQVLTFGINPIVGSVSVSGATTGNGTFFGTPWAMPTGVTLRAGGRFGSTGECCGGLGNPRRL